MTPGSFPEQDTAILEDSRALLAKAETGELSKDALREMMETASEVPVLLPPDRWPSDLEADAYHGLAGDVVGTIDPHTEADPTAILTNFFAFFASAVGSGPHFNASSTRHSLRIFAVLIGATASGRKGTSVSPVKRLFEIAEPDWTAKRISGGLSSGEGLVWNVRDPVMQRQPVKENGRVVDHQEVEIDPGISDKRLLVIEAEFGRTLKVMNREGSILSPVLREAWDSGDLNLMTKNNPARATGAHICVIGHITKDELLQHLSASDSSNGFLNRFIWTAVRRSKLLPEGGQLPESEVQRLGARLGEAISFAKYIGEMRRDEDAKAIWHKVYPHLSEERLGMVGLATGRAVAQIMRIACLYALLDLSDIVKAIHLMAALTYWKRVEESIGYIFGSATGDSMADTIWDQVRLNESINRTAVSGLFHRHTPASRIDRAIEHLQRQRLVRVFKVPTDGRPEIVIRRANDAK